jgi:hypothetical protein
MHEALTKYLKVCMKMIVLIFFTFEKMNFCFFNFESIIEHLTFWSWMGIHISILSMYINMFF